MRIAASLHRYPRLRRRTASDGLRPHVRSFARRHPARKPRRRRVHPQTPPKNGPPGPPNPRVFLICKLMGSFRETGSAPRGSGGSGGGIREERVPSSRIPNPEGEKARSGTRTTCSAFMDGLSWTDAKPIPERDDHRVDFRATRPVPPRGRDLCYFWFEAAPRALAITLGSSPTSSRSALRRRPEGSGS